MSRVYSRSDDPSKKETARAKTYPKANMVDNRLNTVMANEPKPFTDEELAKIYAMIDSDETTDAEYDNLYIALTTDDKIATFKQYLADKVSLKDDTMEDGAADKANADVDKLTSSVKSFSGKTVEKGQQRRRKQTRFYKPAETKMTDDPDNIASDEESDKISLTQEELDAKIEAAVAKATGRPAQAPTMAAPPPAPIVLLSAKEEEAIQKILSERCAVVDCPRKRMLGLQYCSACNRRIREEPMRERVKEVNAKRRAEERKEKDRLEKIALDRLAAQIDARLKQG